MLRLSLERAVGSATVTTGVFLIRRLLRLYPAVFAMVALFALVHFALDARLPHGAPELYELDSLVRHALLLQTEINGVAWTLQVELLGSLLVLVCFFIARRWGEGALALLIAAMIAASFIEDIRWLAAPIPQPGGVMYAFVAGMLVASVGKSIAAALSPRGITIWAASSAAIFLLAAPVVGWSSPWTVIVQVLSGSWIVSALAYGGDFRAGRFLDAGPLRFYGRISYSIYLLHPLTLIVIWAIPASLGGLTAHGVPGVAVAAGLFVLSAAATTPVAWASCRWVERPGMDWGRRLTRALAAASSAIGSGVTRQPSRAP